MTHLKIVTFFMLISLVSLCALASEKVDERIDVAPDSIVEIEHKSGAAVIVGWDKNEVEVTGMLGSNTSDFVFERQGKTVQIEVKTEDGSWGSWGDDDGDQLVIKVPQNARVEYKSINASVELTGIYGGVTVNVVNGAVEAQDLAGRVRLESVNGSIEATKVRGEVGINSVNGDIEIEHSQGDKIKVSTVNGSIEFNSPAKDARVESVNGDIELELSMVNDLVIETVNGKIEARMTLARGATVKAGSVSGRIELEFDDNVTARFDVQSHAGGNIVNKLTSDKPTREKNNKKQLLEFTTGSPDASVNITTVSGKVVLDSKK